MVEPPAQDRTIRRASTDGWRSALLAAAAVAVIAWTLSGFAAIVQPYLAVQYDLGFELGMVVGQVLFQWCVLWRRTWRERLDYALVLVLVSSLGAVLLWPLLALNRLAPVTVPVALGWFTLVVAIMFFVHWRLVVRKELPATLCVTWVIYRLLLLAVIVKRP
ncbi:MAG: hypothetical protein KIS78_03150 [Labilithrix sp.]|nr:hypothetical protein [Labilithrix sp.]MCW5831440.1 hypothetical protein [Labilithrix sp.]